jgi:molybdopterin molybdotransferase
VPLAFRTDKRSGNAKSFSMVEVEEAQARIIAATQPLGSETIPLREAAGRVLAETVLAPRPLPSFDNSAMDGYAVRASDVARVSLTAGIHLKCIGAVAAGGYFAGTVESGTCVRLFTGSPLPSGADAVVMQEDANASGAEVTILDAVKPWENVRLAGEDVKRGELIGQSGERLTAARLALLGAMGLTGVRVGTRPVIGILGTGNEIVEAGQPLKPGQIFESNRLALAALVGNAGARAEILPLVPDSLEATRERLKQALERSDAVVTTGGVSVGEHDFVKAAFEALGGTIDFWQVAMKPGKPFVFGRLGKKFLFGLPGNPVSAFITFLLLVRPAIWRMQGASDLSWPSYPGVLAESLQNRGGRRHFMRVCVDAAGQVRSAGTQASHVLSSLACASGVVSVAPETTLPAGAAVMVHPLS